MVYNILEKVVYLGIGNKFEKWITSRHFEVTIRNLIKCTNYYNTVMVKK